MNATHAVPAGFRMAGVACGIKASEKRDLTLVVADAPCVAAGVYTTNVVHAASVALNRTKTPCDDCRVVLANSGNANACTGQRGMEDALEMARLASDVCAADPRQALVMSTGVIGVHLPTAKIAAGVQAAARQLANDEEALVAAAQGIMTTDKFPKLASRRCRVGGRPIQLTGFAKGAGMIGPNMATMLAVIMTDVPLTANDAQQLLLDAVDASFNCISVEGHMSTSDTVLMLASGAAGGRTVKGAGLAELAQPLGEVCIELARMIPDDGEGATHLITIEVRGCRTREDARQIARAVADSPLVKTGIAGADPNWGRIVSAAGYAGVPFDPNGLRLSINRRSVFQDGAPTPFDAGALSASMRSDRNVLLELTLKEGDQGLRFWTSDLSVDYVRFNSEYTT